MHRFRKLFGPGLCSRTPMLGVAAVLMVAAPRAAHAQILPPIYKPLPVEEGVRHGASADSLRARAAAHTARAAALDAEAQALRANGGGVVERLGAETDRLRGEAGALAERGRAARQAAATLRDQAETLRARAAEREARAELLAGEIAPEEAEDTAAAPVQRLAARRAELETALSLRVEAEDAARRAERAAAEAGAAEARAGELGRQADQLASIAAEIVSGRAATAGTAARLEREAGEQRQAAEALARQAREQATLAEAYRVQAGRLSLPVRTREESMRFHGETGRSALRNVVLAVGSGGNAGSLHTELLSDYAGPVRLGVGFVIADGRNGATDANGEERPSAAAVERFYAGGGNLAVYGTLPLAFHRSEYHSLTLQTLNKVGLDVPTGRGSAGASRVPANVDLGTELYGTFNTFGGRIRAFSLARAAVAMGNDAFHDALGRPGARSLPYAQLTAGAELGGVAKLLLSGARATDGVDRELALTFQFAPVR